MRLANGASADRTSPDAGQAATICRTVTYRKLHLFVSAVFTLVVVLAWISSLRMHHIAALVYPTGVASISLSSGSLCVANEKLRYSTWNFMTASSPGSEAVYEWKQLSPMGRFHASPAGWQESPWHQDISVPLWAVWLAGMAGLLAIFLFMMRRQGRDAEKKLAEGTG